MRGSKRYPWGECEQRWRPRGRRPRSTAANCPFRKHTVIEGVHDGALHSGVNIKRIRQLERELARKEKALAEAAALLVLKKKVETLYGEDEDGDTNEQNEK